MGLIAIIINPTTVSVVNKPREIPVVVERTDIASSGLTRIACQAGKTEAASAPPNAQIPESIMHH